MKTAIAIFEQALNAGYNFTYRGLLAGKFNGVLMLIISDGYTQHYYIVEDLMDDMVEYANFKDWQIIKKKKVI